MKSVLFVPIILGASFADAAVIAPRDPQGGLLASIAEGNDGSVPDGYSPRAVFLRGFNSILKSVALRTAQEMKLVSRTRMEPVISKNATRYKLRYGPLSVVGYKDPKSFSLMPSLDPNGESFSRMFQPGTICKDDCTVLAGKIYVETVDGTKSNRTSGVYDHHTLTFDLTKEAKNPIGLCDYERIDQSNLSNNKSPNSGFLGSSEDNSDTPTIYTSRNGEIVSGYHLGRENKIMLAADFVNYSNDTKDVFIALEVESIPGLVGWDAATTLVSVVGCKAIPPEISKTERTVTSSKQFPVLVDGAILGAKGHMHNGLLVDPYKIQADSKQVVKEWS